MINRSKIRHAFYRKRNGAEYDTEFQKYIDEAEQQFVNNMTWETFAIQWDVMFSKGSIHIILSEVDIDFIRKTCTQIQTFVDLGLDIEKTIDEKFNLRQRNIYETVELNYAGKEVDWINYGKTWGVSVDYEAKRFTTENYRTVRNEVKFPEPAVPKEKLNGDITIDEFRPMDSAEITQIDKFFKKKKLSAATKH